MSIRINLLPYRELKRAARRRQMNVLLGVAVAIGVLTVALGHMVISARTSNQEARNAFLTQEIVKLDNQIVEIKKIREQTQALLERKQVVETLQSNRTEIVHLFDQMIRLLPDGLYLKSFKQTADLVNIGGYTQSSARVSTLMRSLEDSPWFEQPRLIEIKAATVKNLRANEFLLSIKQTPQQIERDAPTRKGKGGRHETQRN